MKRFLEQNRYRLRSALVAALCTSVLAACAAGPNFHAPEPPATEHYTPDPQPTATVSTEVAGGAAQHFDADADIPAEWWRLLKSQPLDELIRRALKNSPTVASAEATLRSASENYRGERGALLLPTADGTASATREKTSLASFGIPNGGNRLQQSLLRLGPGVLPAGPVRWFAPADRGAARSDRLSALGARGSSPDAHRQRGNHGREHREPQGPNRGHSRHCGG